MPYSQSLTLTSPRILMNLESDLRRSASVTRHDLITRGGEAVSHRPSGKAPAKAINISRLDGVLNPGWRMTHDSPEPAASQPRHAVAISTDENAGSSHLMPLHRSLSLPLPPSAHQLLWLLSPFLFLSQLPLYQFVSVLPFHRFFTFLQYTIFILFLI